MREKDEKVTVEESFSVKTFPDDAGRLAGADDVTTSTPGMLERWVIKCEQSVNILLTVCMFLLFR